MTDEKLQVLDVPAPTTGLKSIGVLTNAEDLPNVPEAALPVKPTLSNKMGIWKKYEDEGLISWVRNGGLSTVEGSKEEGWFAIVPSREPGGSRLGPFKRASLARRASETYLHEQGFVYYKEDIKRSNEIIKKAMKNNRISRKM
jgi:hypothetical protein